MSTHKIDVHSPQHQDPPVVEPATVEPVAGEPTLVDAAAQCAKITVDPDPACSPLWIRLVAAGIYIAVASASTAGGVSFFVGVQSTSTDWVFGTLAFGLAFIAAVGVKESLLPSDWRPD